MTDKETIERLRNAVLKQVRGYRGLEELNIGDEKKSTMYYHRYMASLRILWMFDDENFLKQVEEERVDL